MLGYALFLTAAAVISFQDIRQRIIRNSVLMVFASLQLLIFLFEMFLDDFAKLLWLVSGGVIFFGIYYLLAVFARGNLGGGDVKLAGYLGMVLGYYGGFDYIIYANIVIALLAAAVALVIIFMKRNRLFKIPFAPLMFLGGILTLSTGVV